MYLLVMNGGAEREREREGRREVGGGGHTHALVSSVYYVHVCKCMCI